MKRARRILDGFFEPMPASAALDVLRARAALTDAAAAEEDRSHGRITSAAFVNRRGGELIAEAGSIACERIFGPLADQACRCGKYRGPAHEGTLCEKCGVLCGSSALRQQRFAHVELPGGVVHPALAPVLGAVLGLSADEVLAVSRQQAWLDGSRALAVEPNAEPDAEHWTEHAESSGLKVLRERLAAADPGRLPPEIAAAGFAPTDLLVNAAPVIPPGARPLVMLDDPTVLALQQGPVNEAYRGLAARAHRLDRLRELGAPAIILGNEQRLLQQAFERVHDAVRGVVPPAPQHAWNLGEGTVRELRLAACKPIALDGDSWYPWRNGPPDPTMPCSCLWLDDQRLLFQFPYAALVIARADGRVLAEHAVFGMTARSVDAAGRRVVFLSDSPSESMEGDELVHAGVAVLDTLAGSWLSTYPTDLRAVTVINDQPEDALLSDFRTGESAALDIASDRPGLYAIARDHRFVWAGGTSATGLIVNADTGIVHVEVEEGLYDAGEGPFLRSSGKITEEASADADADEDGDEGAVAFTLTPAGRFRILDPEGVVRENDHKLFTLAFPRLAAAFDASGNQLLILGPREAIIVEITSPPRITQRIRLAALRPLLAPPARARLSEAARDALLQRIGTMRGLARAPDALFAELELDAKTARALRKAAAALPSRPG